MLEFGGVYLVGIDFEVDFFAACELCLNHKRAMPLFEVKGAKTFTSCHLRTKFGGTLLWVKKKLSNSEN